MQERGSTAALYLQVYSVESYFKHLCISGFSCPVERNICFKKYNEKMKLSQDTAPDFRRLFMQLWGGKLCSEEKKREGSTKQQEGLGGWEAMRWKTEKCQ